MRYLRGCQVLTVGTSYAPPGDDPLILTSVLVRGRCVSCRRDRVVRTMWLFLCLILSCTAIATASDASSTPPLQHLSQGQHPHRIMGGVDAEEAAWVWMAALVSRGEDDAKAGQFCDGVLIAPQWVMTAAHCFFNVIEQDLDADAVDVVVGRTNLSLAGGERIAVTELVLHPSYDNTLIDYDIALLKLAHPTTIPWLERRVGYDDEARLAVTGTMTTVIGWGVTSEGGEMPATLQQVDLPLVDQDICAEVMGDVTDRMMCAGVIEGGRDACLGDSGGPMMVRDDAGHDTLLGLVSWGVGCGEAEYYGIYTRIARFNAWIDGIVWDEGVRLALGLASWGEGWIEVVEPNGPFANRAWLNVQWPAYRTANGETRPAWCDVDGDKRAELVMGLGRGARGWLEILEDEAGQYAHLAWIQIPWAAYNRGENGETFPACGDLDGDGLDELVIGLGSGGEGWFVVLDDAHTGYAVQTWLHVAWPHYQTHGAGSVHPAVGNLDEDEQAELVLGLGRGGGGWFRVLDDQTAHFSPLGWQQVGWSTYQAHNGTVWPAICDLDGDGIGEVVLGLGSGGGGWLRLLNSAPHYDPITLADGWLQLVWPGNQSANGETFPACADLDRDMRDELLIGMGDGGGGFFHIRDDLNAGLLPLGWKRSHWDGYNEGAGVIRPAAR